MSVASSAFRLVPAFPPTIEQRDRAIALWHSENVLAPDVAEVRARELVLLIERADGALAGVCTVKDLHAPLAQARVWMYRMFLRAADRGGLIGIHALGAVYDLLKERTPQGGPCGVFLATENRRLDRRSVTRRFERLGWTPLGVNPLGQRAWLRRF